MLFFVLRFAMLGEMDLVYADMFMTPLSQGGLC